MKSNIMLLDAIYSNVRMGLEGIDYVIDTIDDKNFLDELKKEKKEYETIATEALELYNKYCTEEKDVSPIAKVSSYISTNLKLLKDSTVQNIAKMMMEGTNKGIIELTEKMHTYKAESDVNQLAEKLISIEEDNIEVLKPYL